MTPAITGGRIRQGGMREAALGLTARGMGCGERVTGWAREVTSRGFRERTKAGLLRGSEALGGLGVERGGGVAIVDGVRTEAARALITLISVRTSAVRGAFDSSGLRTGAAEAESMARRDADGRRPRDIGIE